MNNFLPRCIFLLLSIFLMVGCATTDYQIVEKVHYNFTSVGTALTDKIIPMPPPPRDEYIFATPEKRSEMMTDYAGHLLKITRDLNNRLDAIRDLDEKNAKRIEKANADEEARVKAYVSDVIKATKNRK